MNEYIYIYQNYDTTVSLDNLVVAWLTYHSCEQSEPHNNTYDSPDRDHVTIVDDC